MKNSLKFVLVSAIALSQLACSASLKLRSGQTIDGDIIKSDAQNVYVNDYSSGKKETIELPRAEIVEVAHPGKGLGITGSVLTGVGLAFGVAALATTVPERSCESEFGCAFQHMLLTTPSAMFMTVGLSTMIPGWVMYTNSQDRMEVGETATKPTFGVLPVVVPRADGPPQLGMAAQGRW